MNEHPQPDATLDITKDLCPLTFVKTKLELEDMEPGKLLQVRLRVGEPLENVARSVTEEGHTIVSRDQVAPGIWQLIIQRGRI